MSRFTLNIEGEELKKKKKRKKLAEERRGFYKYQRFLSGQFFRETILVEENGTVDRIYDPRRSWIQHGRFWWNILPSSRLDGTTPYFYRVRDDKRGKYLCTTGWNKRFLFLYYSNGWNILNIELSSYINLIRIQKLI